MLIVGSPRTPKSLLLEIQERTGKARARCALIPFGANPPYAELLREADSIFVTADSVAMVSDAIATGKPVELVGVLPTLLGRSVMALMDRIRPSKRTPPHDLRVFWRTLQDGGLVGTQQIRRFPVPDVNRLAASRAKAILDNSS